MAEHFSPSLDRFVRAHVARRRVPRPDFRPGEEGGAEGLVDCHFHAHEGQHDGLATAQLASLAGMRGLIIKSLRPMRYEYPARDVKALVEQLEIWASAEGVKPVSCVAGYITCLNPREPDPKILRQNLEEGVQVVWLPVGNTLATYTRIGSPQDEVGPLSISDAKERGALALLDAQGELKDEFKTIIELVAEYGRTLFFGHRTHPELFAAAKYAHQCGIDRLAVDHPFSPFIDLSIEDMQALKEYGVKFNFTYNELSPVVGVDPVDMVNAIKTVGSQHFTVSSDAGDLIFPNSVECMRLMAATLMAYGLSEEDMRQVGSDNGAFLMGLESPA